MIGVPCSRLGEHAYLQMGNLCFSGDKYSEHVASYAHVPYRNIAS